MLLIRIKQTLIAALFITISLNAGVFDIIQPVKIKSGVTDSVVVQDLFYAENYNVALSPNSDINATYDGGSNVIKFAPNMDFYGFTTLQISNSGEVLDIPIVVNREQRSEFNYKPWKDYKELTVFGSFNGWNRHEHYMKDDDGDGIFTVEVPVEPGNYQYKFYGDGEEIVDPNNPDSISNGSGSFNSILDVLPLSDVKTFLHIQDYTKSENEVVLQFSYEHNASGKLDSGKLFVFVNNNLLSDNSVEVSGNSATVKIDSDLLSGKKQIRVTADVEGEISNTQNIVLFDGEPAGYNNSDFTWYDATIYSIMVDRFNDGDSSINAPIEFDSLKWKANYLGGDLQGIINKLEDGYFDKLGINTIWISPVYDNPNKAYKEYPAPHRYYSGYHGYWPSHHERIEEKFGDMSKLKELIDTAKEHNIKILLDFVSNHVHENHPFFKENRNWFGQLDLPDGRKNLRFFDEFRLTTWFEPYLPSFDYNATPEVIEAMTENALWWLKTTGAAGFRHDAVKHVPNEFWRELTRRIKSEIESKENREVYQIGETFGSYDLISSYVNNGQLSSQFNFNLYDRAIWAFIDSSVTFGDLDKEMHKTFDVYGYLHKMGNIMDSHDKNRYMAHIDGDLHLSEWSAAEIGWNNPPKVDHPTSYNRALLYYAWMNSIPGLPVIYYGSEFGMTGASDPDNRRMMRFDDELNQYERDMLTETRKIINLRKDLPALRYGDFYTLTADENVYSYVRSDAKQRVLVVLNKSDKPQRVDLTFPAVFNAQKVTDLVTGTELIPERNSLSVVIGSYGWSMYLID
ncbi:MAG: hypothetical protein SCALA702_10470 [Melioribacteraceae bacterium]|nr:MAG: hypothetical protein SCALA702_10470 [Melioribacteraceae bacterium]